MERDITEKASYFIKYGVLGLIVLSVAAAFLVWNHGRGDRFLTVNNAEVAGSLVIVRAKAPGKITEISQTEGSHVENGSLLAKIAVAVTDDDMRQLEENLALAKSNLAELEKGETIQIPVASQAPDTSNLEAARARLARMQELYEMGAISAQKLEEAKSAVEAARAASVPVQTYQTITRPKSPEVLASAALSVRQAETALKTAQEARAATDIYSQVDGSVYYSVKVDDQVKPGDTIAQIGDGEGLYLSVRVTKEEEEKIRMGQPVSYEFGGEELLGTVVEILPQNKKEGEADKETASPNSEANTQANTATEGAPDEELLKDDRTVVKISLPLDTAKNLKPGAKTRVKFML